MATVLESNKTKIAKRVIEVFEFFGGNHRQATVMDIVRQYGRPQSSTSELLASLVEMGLLYKDPRSRTYTPTPRLATLGSGAQPDMVRNGQLFSFIDRLAQSSRHSVALFGMVGTHVQIFRWSPGMFALGNDIGCGTSERLSESAAGQLLLSTLPSDASGKLLRRLNAEAPEDRKFSFSALQERVTQFGRQGYATGAAGFGCQGRVTAMLIPQGGGERPLAVGVVYPEDSAVDPGALIATMQAGLESCGADRSDDFSPMPSHMPSLMRAV
ncbi:helix-turn-helix domain-containing protein [Sphingomonas sp. BIUV-7]|uniref:Helix-turn-helix domain-containing protein n=1 Tax=Sphingomonas natans TaxID=3063330 RepID=A0ABT8Y869_9SPHN|nr:helix-turn-helix domain-containing protein [Sphingomonas sp. BIUV-7]MDO6414518.1 helix-turn-helix domain-containing protein [Sphingomonas sp. BIUV-7]